MAIGETAWIPGCQRHSEQLHGIGFGQSLSKQVPPEKCTQDPWPHSHAISWMFCYASEVSKHCALGFGPGVLRRPFLVVNSRPKNHLGLKPLREVGGRVMPATESERARERERESGEPRAPCHEESLEPVMARYPEIETKELQFIPDWEAWMKKEGFAVQSALKRSQPRAGSEVSSPEDAAGSRPVFSLRMIWSCLLGPMPSSSVRLGPKEPGCSSLPRSSRRRASGAARAACW